ncbi:MAG: hypothetical protein CMJ85_01230 [Planctomycetes bacterium]|nr:hypothetical protein [Planctomycetota bacterium]
MTSLARALAVFMLLAGSCVFTDPHTATRHQTWRLGQVNDASVEVRSRNGSIKVLGEPSRQDVEVEAKLVAGGRSQEEADARQDEVEVHCARESDDRLLVYAVFPEKRRGRDGASFVIRLPSANGARLNTSNGSITVGSIGGQLVATTRNGRIVVSSHDGSADLSTSNGRVTVSGVVGATKIRTSNGRVRVVLADDNAGPLNAQTSNGGIEATVGTAFRGKVTMRTSNGRVRFKNEAGVDVREQLKKRSGSVRFGDGSTQSSLRSSNGSVTLTVK